MSSPFSNMFNGLFSHKGQHPISLVQTALEPIHEENIAEGGEFLDDLIREEEDAPSQDENK